MAEIRRYPEFQDNICEGASERRKPGGEGSFPKTSGFEGMTDASSRRSSSPSKSISH
jgi:hypothetical protein